MGDKTGISWTDATWGPVRGCSRISPGCQACYAERIAARFSDPGMPYHGFARRVPKTVGASQPRWTGVVQLVPEHLADPIKWRKPRRIFVSSMSDVFHEKLSNEAIAVIFGVMAACPQHTFQVLTKRAARVREWFAWLATEAMSCNAGVGMTPAARCFVEAQRREPMNHGRKLLARGQIVDAALSAVWPLSNVWLGTSVENQDAGDERLPELASTPAAVRFVSCEPLLGPLSLVDFFADVACRTGKTWIIAGCESGHGARPCEVDWLRSIRDQCGRAGVAFFLKQATQVDGAYTITDLRPVPQVLGRQGELIPVVGVGAGSKEKGRSVIELPYLDGVQWAQFPEVSP